MSKFISYNSIHFAVARVLTIDRAQIIATHDERIAKRRGTLVRIPAWMGDCLMTGMLVNLHFTEDSRGYLKLDGYGHVHDTLYTVNQKNVLQKIY